MKKIYSLLLASIFTLTGYTQILLPDNLVINGGVNAMVKKGNILYLGGYFHTVNGLTRNCLAAYDLSTHSLTSWNPNVVYTPNTGEVTSMVLKGDTIFLCGIFVFVGGQNRLHIAAVSATTGAVLDWVPSKGFPPPGDEIQSVTAMTLKGDTLFVGGMFRRFEPAAGGYYPKNNVAAINARTGGHYNWGIPRPDWNVLTMATSDNSVYIGGNFTSLEGYPQPRRYAVAADAHGIQVLPWNPNPNGSVHSFLVKNDIVYMGGLFTTVGGLPKTNLVALDPVLGIPLAFNPNPNGGVYEITPDGSNLYVGGDFLTIGGQTKSRIALIDGITGLANPSWNADVDNIVRSIIVDGDYVYMGGRFTTVQGQQRTSFAILQNAINAPLPVHLLSFNANPDGAGSLWKVTCTWSTASETNSSLYFIERSTDRRTFKQIGQVAAAGNTSSVRNYTFTDPSPQSGITYYRLKQVDQDGKFTYSATAVVNINSKETVIILYPNPVKDFMQLIISSPDRQRVNYSIVDATGKQVKSGRFQVEKGNNRFDLNASEFSTGNYTLIVTNELMQKRLKFVKH